MVVFISYKHLCEIVLFEPFIYLITTLEERKGSRHHMGTIGRIEKSGIDMNDAQSNLSTVSRDHQIAGRD